MSAETGALVASVLGFLGALMLVYPAWRVGRTMRQASRLRARLARPSDGGERPAAPKEKRTVSSHEVAERIADLLETHVADWRPFEHGMLVAGIGLIALSFGIEFWAQLPD